MKKGDQRKLFNEIQAALSVAITADEKVHDEEDSSIDADTFKQIARSLNRALRLFDDKPKPLRVEQDADLLFDARAIVAKSSDVEMLCAIDDALNIPSSPYDHREIFRLIYLTEESGKDSTVKAILRDLKRGVPALTIAQQFEEGTYNVRKGARQ